jgi:hypothetical protein
LICLRYVLIEICLTLSSDISLNFLIAFLSTSFKGISPRASLRLLKASSSASRVLSDKSLLSELLTQRGINSEIDSLSFVSRKAIFDLSSAF